MGQRLQKLREATGMSQSQLARASGIPVGTLQGWEQGRRKPLLETAAVVAKALGVAIEDLAGPVTIPASAGPAPAGAPKSKKTRRIKKGG